MQDSEAARAARRAARRVYSARDVAGALRRMALALTVRLADRDPVVLAVMHGGAFTALELAKHFRFPCELDYVHVTRYQRGTKGGALRWLVRPGTELAGRTVLVVDDILDHGHTLRALDAELRRVGASEIVTAVLVVKRTRRRRSGVTVDVAGLEVDDVYVFGCGMDYRGYWRGLRAIYALPPGFEA